MQISRNRTREYQWRLQAFGGSSGEMMPSTSQIIHVNGGMIDASLDTLLMAREDQILTPEGHLTKSIVPAIAINPLRTEDWQSPAGIAGIVRTRRMMRGPDRVEEHRELCSCELFDAVAVMGGMGLSQGVSWLREMTTAVLSCHEQGLTHGQIRPEHVMLDPADAVKLLGFGPIAWRQVCRGPSIGDRHALRPVQRLDAPELQGRSHATIAELQTADVWALGVIFAAILAGEPPRLTSSGDVEMPSGLQSQPVAVRLLLQLMLSTVPNSRPSVRQLDTEISKMMTSPMKRARSPGGNSTCLDMARTDSGLSEISDAPTRNASLKDLELNPGASRPANSPHLDGLYAKLRVLEARPVPAQDGKSAT